MIHPVHYSSNSMEWSTPEALFKELDSIFHFDLDACASDENAKCKKYYTKEDDALTQDWHGTVWMNPPYGRQISQFMKKAYEQSQQGATVVCLVPARTDTKWWHQFVLHHATVIYLRGRVKFGKQVTRQEITNKSAKKSKHSMTSEETSGCASKDKKSQGDSNRRTTSGGFSKDTSGDTSGDGVASRGAATSGGAPFPSAVVIYWGGLLGESTRLKMSDWLHEDQNKLF